MVGFNVCRGVAGKQLFQLYCGSACAGRRSRRGGRVGRRRL